MRILKAAKALLSKMTAGDCLEVDGLRFACGIARMSGERQLSRLEPLTCVETLAPQRSVYRDGKGRRMLVLEQPVPTFDSGDREWDSYRRLFLIPEGGKMTGIWVAGGIRVAEVRTYRDLRCADDKTERTVKEYLRRLSAAK